jgi:Fic family protein
MTPSFAEPYIPSEQSIARSVLPEKAIELEQKSHALDCSMAAPAKLILEKHMRAVNSYCSNLIEGNNTKPWAIRRAAAGDYNADPVTKNLQLEAVAHMRAQDWLREQSIDLKTLCSRDFICELHRVFYAAMPDSMLVVKNDARKTESILVPGAFRECAVIVGRHVPPDPNDLETFISRFQDAYSSRREGIVPIIAAMAAHHRLVWVHPFLDGNGRVARLFTDEYLRQIGVGGAGLWIMSRGLALSHTQYKLQLHRADIPRQGDYDGRGNLSEKELIAFCVYMLDTALNQVDYITELLQFDSMIRRIKSYVLARNEDRIPQYGKLPPEASTILKRAFVIGTIERRELYEMFHGRSERTIRATVQQLKAEGLLSETSSLSPLSWAIPEHAESYYLPNLNP